MHINLFAAGDSVLLLGEGNFSFAAGVVDLNLSVDVTATCLESEVTLQLAKKNIVYLKQKGVKVLLGVDATKLHEHEILGSEIFQKIIFNFPHVGGKMKIHLNRILLQQFFQSASNCIAPDGKVIVSLCKGQGGTKVDCPIRRWDDTWQIVEMAAYGDFILESVEPFRSDFVPNYSSVGYRGGDSAFHTKGALVHVFSKREPFFPNMDLEILLQYPEYGIIDTTFQQITCSAVHSAFYKKNPFLKDGSVMNFFVKELEVSCAGKPGYNPIRVKLITEEEIPLYSTYLIEDSRERSLRQSLFDNTDKLLQFWNEQTNDIIMFPGLVFNSLGADFSQPPVSCQIMLIGCDMVNSIKLYFSRLFTIFNRRGINIAFKWHEDITSFKKYILPKTNMKITEGGDIHLEDGESGSLFLVGQIFSFVNDSPDVMPISMCLIDPEVLSVLLFHVEDWRQIWAAKTHVLYDDTIPVLKLSCIETVVYTLDISFSLSDDFSEHKFYLILWLYGAQIVTNVKFLNHYESPDGWKSSCYRITYQSFDKPLNRKKAIEIQENVIAKVLTSKLGVIVR